jgi:Spermidine synthase tetramerisation domain
MEPQHATENTDTTEENKETDKATDDRPVKSEIFKGWFNEWIELSCGGHAMCLKIDEVLFHEKSPYQDILIFKRLSTIVRLPQLILIVSRLLATNWELEQSEKQRDMVKTYLDSTVK